MTRNSDLDCDDLFNCTHEAETPISEGGQVIGWLCRCGRRAKPNLSRRFTEAELATCVCTQEVLLAGAFSKGCPLHDRKSQ